jgi:hypothetical protein
MLKLRMRMPIMAAPRFWADCFVNATRGVGVPLSCVRARLVAQRGQGALVDVRRLLKVVLELEAWDENAPLFEIAMW